MADLKILKIAHEKVKALGSNWILDETQPIILFDPDNVIIETPLREGLHTVSVYLKSFDGTIHPWSFSLMVQKPALPAPPKIQVLYPIDIKEPIHIDDFLLRYIQISSDDIDIYAFFKNETGQTEYAQYGSYLVCVIATDNHGQRDQIEIPIQISYISNIEIEYLQISEDIYWTGHNWQYDLILDNFKDQSVSQIDLLPLLTLNGKINPIQIQKPGHYDIFLYTSNDKMSIILNVILHKDKIGPEIRYTSTTIYLDDLPGMMCSAHDIAKRLDVSIIDTIDGGLSYTNCKFELLLNTEYRAIVKEPGEYILRVYASDMSGNISTCDISFSVLVKPDTDPPEIFYTSYNTPILYQKWPTIEVVKEQVYSYFIEAIIDKRDGIIIPEYYIKDIETITEPGDYVLCISAADKSGNSVYTEIAFSVAYDKTTIKPEIPLNWSKLHIDPDNKIYYVGELRHFETPIITLQHILEKIVYTTDNILITESSGLICITTPGEYRLELEMMVYDICKKQTVYFYLIDEPDTEPPWFEWNESVSGFETKTLHIEYIQELLPEHILEAHIFGVFDRIEGQLRLSDIAYTLTYNNIPVSSISIPGKYELHVYATDSAGNIGTDVLHIYAKDPNEQIQPVIFDNSKWIDDKFVFVYESPVSSIDIIDLPQILQVRSDTEIQYVIYAKDDPIYKINRYGEYTILLTAQNNKYLYTKQIHFIFKYDMSYASAQWKWKSCISLVESEPHYCLYHAHVEHMDYINALSILLHTIYDIQAGNIPLSQLHTEYTDNLVYVWYENIKGHKQEAWIYIHETPLTYTIDQYGGIITRHDLPVYDIILAETSEYKFNSSIDPCIIWNLGVKKINENSIVATDIFPILDVYCPYRWVSLVWEAFIVDNILEISIEDTKKISIHIIDVQ